MRELCNLTPDEAQSVLRQLLKERPGLRKEIADIIAKLRPAVDASEVAANVRFDLESLDIDDVWDSAGADRYGHTDPVDAADEQIVALVEPYLAQMRKFKALKRPDDADAYLAGLIIGLNEYDNEVDSPVKELAEESASSCAAVALRDWRKGVNDEQRVEAMRERLLYDCTGWVNLILLALR